ncbi:SrfA family protein [Pectobacterium colocasium]|uniref:SrfA family protein n=1 Tax=Pectobacterium colocasium TaxID=2878098 RepID=UPI001CD44C0A|nr:SrfA family protein [Pectobacterium colocasium]
MRNSIQGPLLRTGHNSLFKALGETGYPVFKMAFQLREAIYRLDAGHDLARHLAIPQNDQGGDRTDWYSSFPGDIIPWSSANETERASARHQFSEFQTAVQSLSEQLLNADQNGTGGDRKVFAQLLKSVVHFPDYDFVYLVDGVLVITFWGFIHPSGEQRNPMHWLAPDSVPVQAPLAATAQLAEQSTILASETSPVTESVKQPWFWQWRWLLGGLLLLLLLALLLGLLRGCAPSLTLPGLPGLSGKVAVNAYHDSASTVNAQTRSDLSVSTLTNENTVASSSVIEGKQPPAAMGDKNNTINDKPQSLNKAEAADAEKSTDSAQPTNHPPQGNPSPQPEVAPNTTPPVIPPQGEPLMLPPATPDGTAQFLNGQWRANGGIQDKLTGRPLQLQYNFEQGNGTVSVRQSSGVTCNGLAKGIVQQGTLSITNPEQMKCSDGSNFIVPNIECKSPAAGHTDCVGSTDGDKPFPIRILQPNT